MRLMLVSCEIFHREMCAAVARSPNRVDLRFLPKGLHDVGPQEMRRRIQQIVDAIPGDDYDAVIMGYALCNNGLNGLTARGLPLVLPRAHDCITLFLGGKERYRSYFFDNPGVYFHTTGWIERDAVTDELSQISIQNQTGMNHSFDELVAKYGADNARYLHEQLCDHTRHYRQLTFIEMGIEPDDRFERHSRELAAERGWQFEKVQGEMGMIQRLVDGIWAENEFLTVPPGGRVAATQDDRIVAVAPAGTKDSSP